MRSRIQLSLAGSVVFLAAVALLTTVSPPEVDADTAPAHKAYKETIPGTEVTFEMLSIPGGTFVMGSPDSEKGRGADEGPQHPVTIRPFWMGKCEVTWDEFDVYRKEKGVKNPDM